MNYYNEIDHGAAAWLRNLIDAGLMPAGEVDERSVDDVRPSDIRGFTQCHFFAGIGGWPYALDLAGWPTNRPVWTGSCPCQSFSAAGNRAGFDDKRHLWPAWFHLISQCRPSAIFGEQAASAIRHGWADLVCADLEGKGYAFAHSVLGAHSAGAPHIRQRLFFVAYAGGAGREGHQQVRGLPSSSGQTSAEHGNAFMPSGRALDSDFRLLRERNGVSVGMERRRVHGFGNAIVPQVAAQFIRAAA